ncbi:MAG: discoidin domain-containing protein, partial [Armatimonadota bacterium]
MLTNTDFAMASAADKSWAAGWEATDAQRAYYHWVNDDGTSGNTSLRYESLIGGPTGAVTQTVSCQKNTEYLLTVALKSDGACVPAVRVFAPDLQKVVVGLVADGGRVWKSYSARFNSGNLDKLTVCVFGSSAMFDNQPGPVGKSGIDDVQIYAAGDVPAALKPQGLFTPPGPNLALHKPYTVSETANYVDTADPEDAIQLTDGEYSTGYFWVQKSTVGWTRVAPVQITIDLGKLEPIAGVSYSTAGGIAGVTWPASVSVLTSDDGNTWTCLGDLVRLCTRQGGPRSDVYGTYRYATGDLKGAGRYVRLVVDGGYFTVVDEIEVYQGTQSFLTLANAGPKTTDPLQFYRRLRVANAIVSRLRTDLSAAREAIGAAGLPDGEKTRLLGRAEELDARIEQLPEAAPAGFKAIFPLNDVHAGIYALNAPLLRARGYKALTSWQGNRWDNLRPTEAPERAPAQAPSLLVPMMSNEYRAEAFNLTNATDRELRLSLNVTGLPGGKNPKYLSPRQVLFTDTIPRQPVAAALPQAPLGPKGYDLSIPAGMTRQVWLAFHPTD